MQTRMERRPNIYKRGLVEVNTSSRMSFACHAHQFLPGRPRTRNLVVTESGVVYVWGTQRLLGVLQTDAQAADEHQRLHDIPLAIMVSCGPSISAVVCSNGSLWTWGEALGSGHTVTQHRPTEIPSETFSAPVAMIACGCDHSVALTATGQVWTCGGGAGGALGHGDYETLQTFTHVVSLAPFVCCMVATGQQHSVVLQGDGTMWTFGLGERGQLGHGRYESSNSPLQVPGDFCNEGEMIEMVAAGGAHSACITNAGDLWTWGSGAFGQLGVRREFGLQMNRNSPHHVTMPASDGTELENQVLSISCGDFHSLILKRNGSLWGCGRNANFAIAPRSMTGHPQHLDYVFTPLALGADFADTKFASVNATFNASSAVDEQGRVWRWGSGLMGGAGDPNELDILIRTLPQRIGRCHELRHEHALAFLMACVQRLSVRDDAQPSRVRELVDNEQVLRHILFPMCNRWPRGPAGLRLRSMPGLLRLLGGFLVRHAMP